MKVLQCNTCTSGPCTVMVTNLDSTDIPDRCVFSDVDFKVEWREMQ